MEPFRVTCETCRSRLKVRSADAIGQILACPKCSSMVLIVPPAGWTGEVPGSTAVASNPAAESLLSVSSTVSTIVPSEFNFDVPLEPTPTSAAPPPIATPEETVVAETSAGGISPLVWVTIGGAAIFVVAGAAYVLWLAGSKGADKPVIAAATQSPAAPVTDAPASETSTTQNDHDEAAKSQVPPAADKPDLDVVKTQPGHANEAAASPLIAAPPVAEPKPEPIAQPATPPASVKPAAEDKPAIAETKPAAPPTTSVALATPPAPAERPDQTARAGGGNHVLKFDPLDFDPEHLSLSSTPGTTSTSSLPPAPPSDTTAADAAPAKAPEASDVLPPPVQNNQAINVRRGAATPDDARPLVTAQHLALKVKDLELTDVPIARFVETISQITGAAITLDPIALELNGQSPRTTVSMKVSDAALEKPLQDALAAQRLALIEQDSHATIGLAGSDERKPADFDVKDLVEGGDATPIAKLVETFVAPRSWKSNGGKGTLEVQGGSLHIDQTLAVRREVLIFCERLRLARNRPLRSKYPAELLAIESPYEKLAAPLGKSTTFTFLAWSRLADVFTQWQQLAGITVLVDWSALADINLRPTSPIACSTIDRPWEEALDGTLEPLGLTWRAVDSQTIQITSLDALDRIERVEFYTVPKKLRDDATPRDTLVESLQKQIDARPNKHGKSDEPLLQVDEPSGRLIVRATPDAHRFLTSILNKAQ